MPKIAVVVPNWNGADHLKECLDSLLAQSLQTCVIVVDNGSVDNSLEILQHNYQQVELIRHEHNQGFAGGVNAGIRSAIKDGCDYVATFNNDAVADKDWLKNLAGCLDNQPTVGVATCKLLHMGGDTLDSTGDFYTIWGLPFPRGRGDAATDKYDNEVEVFGASGGASLYRCQMLQEIGLFDEDFFAYYEDVDLSFRAQLAGWSVRYVPTARAYHHIGATSAKIPGFTAYQTIKNLPLIYIKDVPGQLLFSVGWRLALAHTMFVARAISRGQVGPVLKGSGVVIYLFFKKLPDRRSIQSSSKLTGQELLAKIVHDLPPNAYNLRRLRNLYRKDLIK